VLGKEGERQADDGMDGQHLGFVGVGRMGGPMALRLLDAGHRLTVYDVDGAAMQRLVDRGAEAASSPAEVAAATEVVLTSLPTPLIVHEVALGPGGIAEGPRVRRLIDLSTIGPGAAVRLAAGLAERGIHWLEAPVSGGVRGARDGTLAVMVTCPKDLYEVALPILRTFGKVFLVGDKPGLAQVVKLGNNLLSLAAVAITSEALAMGVKAGVDPKVMLGVINAGSGRNSATEDKFPQAVLPGTFDFGFTTGLSYKDVRLCVDEAETLGVPMLVGAAVRELLAITNARFGPDSDFTSIAKLVEDWAGVQIRG
jgi:3-hydroxyisobutyrate dehydrogenase-like beta-hydroxyacid dehydrogenase